MGAAPTGAPGALYSGTRGARVRGRLRVTSRRLLQRNAGRLVLPTLTFTSRRAVAGRRAKRRRHVKTDAGLKRVVINGLETG